MEICEYCKKTIQKKFFPKDNDDEFEWPCEGCYAMGRGYCLPQLIIDYIYKTLNDSPPDTREIKGMLFEFAWMMNNFRKFESEEDVIHKIEEFLRDYSSADYKSYFHETNNELD